MKFWKIFFRVGENSGWNAVWKGRMGEEGWVEGELGTMDLQDMIKLIISQPHLSDKLLRKYQIFSTNPFDLEHIFTVFLNVSKKTY